MTAPDNSLPRDGAKLILWAKGQAQPLQLIVLRKDAESALADFASGVISNISFKSYPDGSGLQSESCFRVEDLRGVTIEYPTIQLVSSSLN